ncbi:hypothetical protein AW736_04160 [Termitidicoccus mucosus]|uniref:Sialidase domain-containing protein n=2 Tax=Termitidicoccus mucosus TaxID=1184151 RepID=A0A178IMZ3_9BACT|nr:hypothetical protein AW736_04160 [Opitutaceae bacterium TSB47]
MTRTTPDAPASPSNATADRTVLPAPVNGYRGIWYALGYVYEHGDKYSGGLGTYTADHVPMAVYAPAVKKTFFTYGGTTGETQRQLVIMVSYYDHARHEIPRPVALHTDIGVDDPHDNATLHIDADGHIWIFKSGRALMRPGIIYKSRAPYSIEAFENVSQQEFTYPQAWPVDGDGWLMLFTKYRHAQPPHLHRELYWKTSRDGRGWSADTKLAGFGGHYQVSARAGRRIGTFFNWHPGGDNDRRTNIYYAQTDDFGKTWTNVAGKPLALPLPGPVNDALVEDLQSHGRLAYTSDLNFDETGAPVLLFVTSSAAEPGPRGEPREWTTLHWRDGAWRRRVVTTTGHNYDMGSLYVHGKKWGIVAPSERGPQAPWAGGEMALWVSPDEGATWKRDVQITKNSLYNHSYARRPIGATDPFYSFWADGDPTRMSRSHLYFCDSTGRNVWRLPYNMDAATAKPEKIRT